MADRRTHYEPYHREDSVRADDAPARSRPGSACASARGNTRPAPSRPRPHRSPRTRRRPAGNDKYPKHLTTDFRKVRCGAAAAAAEAPAAFCPRPAKPPRRNH